MCSAAFSSLRPIDMEPIGTLAVLALVPFYPEGTKITILPPSRSAINRVIPNPPSYTQGIRRYFQGSSSTDLHHLTNPLHLAVQVLDPSRDPRAALVFQFARQGLVNLRKTYTGDQFTQRHLSAIGIRATTMALQGAQLSADVCGPTDISEVNIQASRKYWRQEKTVLSSIHEVLVLMKQKREINPMEDVSGECEFILKLISDAYRAIEKIQGSVDEEVCLEDTQEKQVAAKATVSRRAARARAVERHPRVDGLSLFDAESIEKPPMPLHILDGISVISALAALKLCPQGTKLIHDESLTPGTNPIRFNLPTFTQGIWRKLQRSSSEEIDGLTLPIVTCAALLTNEKVNYIFEQAREGLAKLRQTYESDPFTQQYLSAVSMDIMGQALNKEALNPLDHWLPEVEDHEDVVTSKKYWEDHQILLTTIHDTLLLANEKVRADAKGDVSKEIEYILNLLCDVNSNLFRIRSAKSAAASAPPPVEEGSAGVDQRSAEAE